MKLIKTIALKDGAYEDIVLTESVYADDLRSRGRRAAVSEGLKNPMWVYPRDAHDGAHSVQILFAEGRQTHYSIQP